MKSLAQDRELKYYDEIRSLRTINDDLNSNLIALNDKCEVLTKREAEARKLLTLASNEVKKLRKELNSNSN